MFLRKLHKNKKRKVFMRQIIRVLFCVVAIFSVTLFPAKAIDADLSDLSIEDSSVADLNQAESADPSDVGSGFSETAGDWADSVWDQFYTNLISDVSAKYNDAQIHGGIAGSVNRTLDYLDRLQILVKRGDLPNVLENSFVANQGSIREKLQEVETYEAAPDLERTIVVDQDGGQINVANAIVIPIWMRSAELHFQKAASDQSSFEFVFGMQVLDTILFQQETREVFVYHVDPVRNEQELEFCSLEDAPEENDDFLSKFNRRLEQAQAVIDGVSPLTFAFDWIHKGVTGGEERTEGFSQEYWDIRQHASDVVHDTINLASNIPGPVGKITDVYGGLFYLSQGDWKNAAWSFVPGSIPKSKHADDVLRLVSDQKGAVQPLKNFNGPKSPKNFKPLKHGATDPKNYIPTEYAHVESAKRDGIIYRIPGTSKSTHGDANTVRIMRPTSDYPNGYWVKYNKDGHMIDIATGKQASGPENAHIPLPEGYWH